MKTIVIFNSYDYGSTGTLCFYLKQACEYRGYKTIFICGNKKKTGNADYYVADKNNKLLRFIINKGDSMFGKLSNIFRKIPTKKTLIFLKKNIDYKNDEVIFHFHNMQYSFLDIKSLISYAKSKNIKTMLTMHDCWPLTGGCNYFDLNNCQDWHTKHCNKCKFDFKNSNKEIKLKGKILKETTIISPSIWLDKLVSKSILAPTKHFVINNGIDTDFWSFAVDRKKGNEINLISVASPWDKRKGLSFLNELSDILPTNYTLTVVGLEDSQKTNPKIRRFGKLDKFQLRDLYSKSHIFINPTLEDNFPTVNIEALLCGLFICSFDTGGSKEIYNSETGHTILERTANSLLNSILDYNYSEELCSKCRNRGLLYNKQAFCSAYIKVYDDLLS